MSLFSTEIFSGRIEEVISTSGVLKVPKIYSSNSIISFCSFSDDVSMILQ